MENFILCAVTPIKVRPFKDVIMSDFLMEIWGKLEDKTWSYSFTVFDVLPNWSPLFTELAPIKPNP